MLSIDVPILFALSAISVTVRSATFAVAAPSYSKTDKLLFLINFFLLNISHILFECCPLMHFFPSVLQYLLNSYLLYLIKTITLHFHWHIINHIFYICFYLFCLFPFQTAFSLQFELMSKDDSCQKIAADILDKAIFRG